MKLTPFKLILPFILFYHPSYPSKQTKTSIPTLHHFHSLSFLLNYTPFQLRSIMLYNSHLQNWQPRSSPAMLSLSHKPQILRSHEIQSKERIKFNLSFAAALNQLLPSSLNKKMNSSPFLMRVVSILPDLYYTLVTLLVCRRRLGEEYTYIAMYKQKQYLEEGVLLNKKTRLLLFLLEIVSRNALLPLVNRLSAHSSAFEQSKNGSQKPPPPPSLLQKTVKALGRYLGGAQEIMSNVEWLILMVYMLDWNKHFTFIETLLGIRYAYTYKNDQIREVSYVIEGYLLLATFAVKAAKTLYSAFKTQEKASGVKEREGDTENGQMMSQNKSSIQKESKLCRICYDEIKEKSATKCGHTFCWSCIIKTLEMSQECPVCRSNCLPREVVQLRNAC